ncbi:MAG: hypothetical protein ACI9O4_001453 [Chitinophagales bacterium]|jgi:hypothetical protein
MMKKVLLLNLLCFAFFSVFAQTQVGRTTYDLQTNNANCRRVATNATGEVVITYTKSLTGNEAASDRGTGYNFKNAAGVWSETNFPASGFTRFDIARTGWSNIGFLANGKEMIVTHFADDVTAFGGLQIQDRALGSGGTWSTTSLNSTNPSFTYTDDATWPRMAVTGDSIFIVSSVQIGTFVNGVDGGLYYHRSLDGGATWTEGVLPFVNGSNFITIGADSYAVDGNDNGVIAVVVGRYNSFVLKSTDFGTTWTSTKMIEVLDENGLPTANNFSGESSESAIRQDISDESYSIVVDDSDMVHVWMGKLEYEKIAFQEGTVIPFAEGLLYWNETMSAPKTLHASRFTVEAGADCDPLYPNTVINDPDFIQFGLYSSSFSSQPSGAYGDNGDLVVAYSRMRTAAIDTAGLALNATADGFLYKDVFVLKSSDNGVTWDGPINVSSQDTMECAYPGVPRKFYGGNVPLIWMQDARPGNALQPPPGYVHNYGTNTIEYADVSVASIVTPADITCPTIVLLDPLNDSIAVASGCPPSADDLSAILNIDDVPQGPDDSMIRVVGALPNFSVPGVYVLDIYLEDSAGNTSSDTVVGIIVNVVADTIPPTFTFNGPDTLAVVSGNVYADPGLVYADNGCTPPVPTETDNVNPTGANGLFTYVYTITDNSGNVTLATRYVNVIGGDITPPAITLNGLATDTVEACTFYNELGATAFDLVDFVVSVTVDATALDINVVGTYDVVYTATDAAGNPATETRTVYVEDNTDPVLSIIDDNDLVTPANSYTEGGINYTYLNETFVAPATAASDPNCNGQIVTVTTDASAVQVSTAGNYTAVFTAVDENGNDVTQNLTVRVGKEPTADFTFIETSSGLILTNTSTDSPNSYAWDFDNGQTSTAAASTAGVPTYSSNDANYPTYNVCLTVRNRFNDAPFNKTASTVCKSVSIPVGIIDRNDLNAAVEIFPNPTNGLLNVEISETSASNLTVEVTNVLGAVIASKELTKVNAKETVTFNLEGNAAGIYFVNISSDNATISKRVIMK